METLGCTQDGMALTFPLQPSDSLSLSHINAQLNTSNEFEKPSARSSKLQINARSLTPSMVAPHHAQGVGSYNSPHFALPHAIALHDGRDDLNLANFHSVEIVLCCHPLLLIIGVPDAHFRQELLRLVCSRRQSHNVLDFHLARVSRRLDGTDP